MVKVGHLYILVDFIVLEMEEDVKIPLILRRPLLATTSVIIDVKKGKITFKVRKKIIEFDIFNAIKHPTSTDSCYRVDLVDEGEGRPISPPTSEQALIFELKPSPSHIRTKQSNEEHFPPPLSCLDFEVEQQVVLSNSHLHILSWHFQPHWWKTFKMVKVLSYLKVLSYGLIKIFSTLIGTLKVNK